MKSSGLSTAFGGNLAIMDVYAAQRMFGRGRTFDRIDIGVQPGRTIAQVQDELRTLLGPGFQVDPPSGRGQQFEAMTAAYSVMVSISSLFALFIGMFIIYNSFAIAVTQRRSEIGILRALGATRQQVRVLFLAESAVTGLIGSIGGLLFGLLIARGIAASIGTLLSDVYGVAQRADEIATSPGLLAAGPRHRRRHQHRRGGDSRLAGRSGGSGAGAAEGQIPGVVRWRKPRRASWPPAILAAVSIGSLAVGESRAVFYVGYTLAIVAVLLLGPLLSLALARAIRPLLKGCARLKARSPPTA